MFEKIQLSLFATLASLLFCLCIFSTHSSACMIVVNFNSRSCSSHGCSDSYYMQQCGYASAGGYGCYQQGYGLCCSTSFTTYSTTGTGQCVDNGGGGGGGGLPPSGVLIAEPLIRKLPRSCGGRLVAGLWQTFVLTDPGR